MKKLTLVAAIAATVLPALGAPALAQTAAEQQRWDSAKARFESEYQVYKRERDRFDAAVARGGRSGAGYGYAPAPAAGYYDDRYATDYDAARYYRDDPRYQERRLSSSDEVYRGSDGRYYCKRSDGTTGLIVGAAAGGILGNVIDGGRRRTGGTLIGGALGALLGRSVEQNQADIRCR